MCILKRDFFQCKSVEIFIIESIIVPHALDLREFGGPVRGRGGGLSIPYPINSGGLYPFNASYY